MDKPFVHTPQGGYGSKPEETEFTQTPLRKLREEAAKNAFTPPPSPPVEGGGGEPDQLSGSGDNGDTGYDTGDTGYDTGEVGDRFGGTFGAERVEAVAVGEDWPQDVTDTIHGIRERLQHQDPGDEEGDYELVEAVGNPPTELIFEGPDGHQYSVEYGTAHTEELSPEQRTPYGLNDELGEGSQRWLDTGDTGE